MTCGLCSKVRASIYIRLSREAGDTNQSKAGMEKDCRQLAADKGLCTCDLTVHVTDGTSGAIRDRPEFIQWKEDATSGRVGCLITWDVDRITREGVNVMGPVLDIVEGKDVLTGQVVRKPVRLLDYTKKLDSGADDLSFRLPLLIHSEIARAERKQILIRNTNTKRRLRENQLYHGGVLPYGYQSAPHPDGGTTLVINPREAKILREIADFIIDGGTLYRAVAMLNEAGFLTRRGKPWEQTSLKVCLCGDAILGRISHNKKPLRGEDGLPLTPREPVLTLQQSEQLRARFGKKRTTPRVVRGARILSGRTKCAHCGSTMYVNAAVRRGEHVTLYRCRGWREDATPCPGRPVIDARLLEGHFEAEFLRLFGDQQDVRVVRRVVDRIGVREIEAELQELGVLITQPNADVVKLSGQITALHAKRVELESMPAEPVEEKVPTGRTVGDVWRDSNLTGRRRLVDRYLQAEQNITVPTPSRPRRPRTAADLAMIHIPWRVDLLKISAMRNASLARVAS